MVARQSTRTIVTAKLPDLSYDYGALEPVISGEIMQLHHSKHHNTYVTNFNAAMEKYAEAEQKGDIAGMIALQGAIKFNGGGHVNHSIFWKNLAPLASAPPEGELLSMIERDFGSLDALQAKFSTQTAAVQGSGWGWLGYDKASGSSRLPPLPTKTRAKLQASSAPRRGRLGARVLPSVQERAPRLLEGYLADRRLERRRR